MPDTVAVSVLICTRNRAEHLARTLETLQSVVVPPDLTAELIVVDNASTDQTAAVIQACRLPQMPVRYLHEARGGKGYAYNAAMGAARGEVLLFTDDDVHPPRDWIEEMSAPILAGRADAVAGGVRLAPHLLRPWMTPLHRSMLASTESLDPDNLEQLVGANMAFSRRVLERVPRFDTALGPGALGFGDDTLFALQLKEAGYRLSAALDVEVEHHPEPSRLLYPAYRDMAIKLGRSIGYISYHWRHDAAPQIHRQMLASALRLRSLGSGKRGRHNSEGIEVRELQHLMRFHSHRQFLRERKRPRHYEQRGLVKLRGG